MIDIVHDDNLRFLQGCADGSFNLIYIDPPFNTGASRSHARIRTVRDEQSGDRIGFGGRRYRTQTSARTSYEDAFDDYLGFLEPRLIEARRVLAADGSLFVHLDAREVHYVKVLLDGIFGRESFMNEIIWAYDYGGRSKRRWPAKHDSILWYARDEANYTFEYDAIDRVPYMAPDLVGPEKAARGKTPTDVWWHTIVPTNSRERTGYPTQKPVGLLERVVRVHSRPGDRLLDFFAGSGTLGEAARRHGRRCTLVDSNPAAIEIMRRRFAACLDAPAPTVQVSAAGANSLAAEGESK
ncbi:MAG: site-specific DNA-methyltransferase [Phycisphaerales bacterium]|nr:site-specific DNA-methyltransferase [Phycisphaerales bacterium]